MRRYITYMVLLAIVEIGLALYLTEWRHTFWDYVQNKNLNGFINQIGIFTVVALLFCLVTSFTGYYAALAGIKWREKLNGVAYKIDTDADNISQRIQEDCSKYPELMLQVMFGLGKAVAYVVVFAISLSLNFTPIYLIIIVVYAIISTLVARWISKPLINLNYVSQMAEATYRNELSGGNFKDCIKIMWSLAVKTKHLAYFQSFYGQIAVVLPIIIVAPSYFQGAMTLGGLMQSTSTMSTVSDNLSYGINSFTVINKLLSCRRRLKEIGVI